MILALLFWLSLGSVVYTYLGYPALVTLLARLRPAPKPYPETTPPVTLLVAAYNEEAEIAAKLENTLALDYPREQLQILIVADGSVDRTPEIVAGFAERGVELLYDPPRKGKMAAINRAMAFATGEIIVFSDANNHYAPNVVRELVAPFADPSVGAVSGAKVIAKGDGALGDSEGLYWRYESFVKQQETRLGCCMGVAGEILAIRRELFEPPPDAVINDDTHMAMRLIKRGFRVVYAPQARSVERVSQSAADERARRARIFAGRYQSITYASSLWPWRNPLRLWQMWSHQTIRTLSALGTLGVFVTSVIRALGRPGRPAQLGFGRGVARFFAVAQIALYGIALLGSLLGAESKLRRVAYLPTFFFNLNWAGLIGLYRFVTKRQTALWQRANRRTDQRSKDGA